QHRRALHARRHRPGRPLARRGLRQRDRGCAVTHVRTEAAPPATAALRTAVPAIEPSMPDPELTPAMTHPTVTGLRLLRLRWWLIALGSWSVALGAAAYYTWAPRSYEAELLIVPKRSGADIMPGRSLLSSLPFDIGDASPFGQSDADRIAAILESRSVTDA